jgi:hypothetical protein
MGDKSVFEGIVREGVEEMWIGETDIVYELTAYHLGRRVRVTIEVIDNDRLEMDKLERE